ncbi:MAG: ABC transporter permease [Micromonosporaceae bacterium]|jgi:ABC-2 type transport system permease protein
MRVFAATVRRLLHQLRHDRRTVALILVVPPVLLTLVSFMFERQPAVFQRVALIMLGMFPLIIMFLLTSIAMLRERTRGTLERLFTTPVGKADLLFAYGAAFGLAAAVQAGVATAYAYGVLGLETAGSAWLVVLIAVANAVLGVALGLLCSAFARTEFQAVQFMPLVVLPQVLLCGLFVPRDQMAGWLEGLSNAMPMSYSVEALMEVGAHATPTALMWRDLAIVAGVVLLALALGATTLRRRTP